MDSFRLCHITLIVCMLAVSACLVPGVSRAMETQKIFSATTAAGDEFGRSVTLGSELLVAGVPENDDHGGRAGCACVFIRETSGWQHLSTLYAPDGDSGDQFGYSVAMDDNYLLIGAFRDDADGNQAGSAYLYNVNGTLVTYSTKITPDLPEPNSEFGRSVDVDGDYLVVGAWRAETGGVGAGAVYIFERNGANWIQDAKITPGDPESGAFFGACVSKSGNELLIGAYGDDSAAQGAGAVYAYRHDGVNWDFIQKMTGPAPEANAQFGCSVSVYGQYALIGAQYATGSSTDTGAAFLYKLNGGTWEYVATWSPDPPTPNGGYGYAVDIGAQFAVVGSPWYADPVQDAGKAWIFALEGSQWVSRRSIEADDSTEGARFGCSVVVKNEEVLVGAYGAEVGPIEPGAAYWFSGFEAPTPTPTPAVLTYELHLYDDELRAGDLFDLSRWYVNPEPARSVDEYIILDIYGAFWFWPGWTQTLDYTTWTVPAAGSASDTILTFTWPAVDGDATGLKFWGAFLQAGTADLLIFDMLEWGYTDK